MRQFLHRLCLIQNTSILFKNLKTEFILLYILGLLFVSKIPIVSNFFDFRMSKNPKYFIILLERRK